MRSILVFVFLTSSTLAQEKLSPSQVTIQKGISLENALKIISTQSKYQVEAAEGIRADALKLSFKDKPFWEALDLLAAEVKGRTYPYGRDGSILILPSTPDAVLHASYDGPFRTTVERLQSSRNFATGAHTLDAHFEVVWEPGFVPLYFQSQPQKLICLDENGKPLGQLVESSQWNRAYGQRAVDAKVTLRLNAKALNRAKSISQLQGELRIRGASGLHQFEFGSLSRLNKSRLPVTRNHQGASCAVSEVQFGRRRWSITIQAKLAPGGPLLESWQAQNWIVNNRLTLSSEKETLTPSSRKANVSARSASFVYHFEPPPKLSLSDLKLSYEMPLKLIEVPIRFQFKNLKLP